MDHIDYKKQAENLRAEIKELTEIRFGIDNQIRNISVDMKRIEKHLLDNWIEKYLFNTEWNVSYQDECFGVITLIQRNPSNEADEVFANICAITSNNRFYLTRHSYAQIINDHVCISISNANSYIQFLQTVKSFVEQFKIKIYDSVVLEYVSCISVG